MHTLLLQTQVYGTIDTVNLGTWMIGGLLALIAFLIVYIWNDSKAQLDTKHRDIIDLINRIASRQDKIEEEQVSQKFQIVALNGAFNAIQNKPIHHDNTALV